MKTNNQKQVYSTPVLVSIKLDTEISLQLQSAPPEGPGEGSGASLSPEYFNNDPFKPNMG
ncbi:MAG: hypothetical protein ACOYMD_01930 [Paludibacter sp.]